MASQASQASQSNQFSTDARSETLDVIRRVIDCLVNIKDETGEFLMPLEDGRIIDTKGWNDWEVCCIRRPKRN